MCFFNVFSQMSELCRLCLDQSDQLYNLDSDFCILVMESGASVTIADAMKYLAMEIKIPVEKPLQTESADEENEVDPENNEIRSVDDDDDPNLPKVS